MIPPICAVCGCGLVGTDDPNRAECPADGRRFATGDPEPFRLPTPEPGRGIRASPSTGRRIPRNDPERTECGRRPPEDGA